MGAELDVNDSLHVVASPKALPTLLLCVKASVASNVAISSEKSAEKCCKITEKRSNKSSH